MGKGDSNTGRAGKGGQGQATDGFHAPELMKLNVILSEWTAVFSTE